MKKKLPLDNQMRSLDATGFYSDCQKKDMYYAALIRCHADAVKITGITIEDMPEDCFLFTADDIPGKKNIELNNVITKVFGFDNVSYDGEPVGIVVAPNEVIARQLAEKATIVTEIGNLESALQQAKKSVDQNILDEDFDDDEDDEDIPSKEEKNNFDLNETNENSLNSNIETDKKDDNYSDKSLKENNTDFSEEGEKKDKTVEAKDMKQIVSLFNDMPSLDTIYDKHNFAPNHDQRVAHRKLKTGLFTEMSKEEVYEKLKTDDDIFVTSKWEQNISNPYWQETNGAFAYMESGNIHVYTPTKWTYYLQKTLTEVLNIPSEKIYIHKTLSAENKSSGLWRTTRLAAQVAVAAYKMGKPVKLVLSHKEEDSYIPAGVHAKFTYKSLVSKHTGVIKSMEIHIHIDVGSGNPFAQEITDRMAIASCNYYTPENIYINSYAHLSKNPPTSISIKTVDSQAFFAIENHMQQISAKVEIPLPEECSEKELQKILSSKDEKNIQYFKVQQRDGNIKYVVIDKEKFDVRLINSGNENFPLKLNLGDIKEAIFRVKEQSDFDRKYVTFQSDAQSRMHDEDSSFFALPLRGIGLSTAYNNSGFLGKSTIPFDPKIEATLTANNNVVIHARTPSDSIKNIWRNIVAQSLLLKSENNKDIIEIDSNFALDEIPKIPEDANNFVSIMNELLRKCCNDIKKKHFQQALPIYSKKSMPHVSKKVWDTQTFSGNPFYNTAFAACVIEVELDLYTYSEKIKNLWLVIDCGEILDENAVRKTVSLEIQQELSALVEGKSVTCEKFHIEFLPSKRKPCQINKLIHNTVPAAFSSALSLALTTSLSTMPCTEKTLFQLVQNLNKSHRKVDEDDKKKEEKTLIISNLLKDKEQKEKIEKETPETMEENK